MFDFIGFRIGFKEIRERWIINNNINLNREDEQEK
jgi:hypothetical protein